MKNIVQANEQANISLLTKTYSAFRAFNADVSIPTLNNWRPEISLHIDDRSPVYFETDIEKRWLANKSKHCSINIVSCMYKIDNIY